MLKHILIATDGSEAAQRASVYALELAAVHGARGSALVATEPWSVLEMAHKAEAGVIHPLEDYEKARAKAAGRILDDVAAHAKERIIACDLVHAADQHPAEAILAAARERACDLIVMASHGRRGLDRILLGSQSAKVLALSAIPVLIHR